MSSLVTGEKVERVEISHNSSNPCFYLLNPFFISRSTKKKIVLQARKLFQLSFMAPTASPLLALQYDKEQLKGSSIFTEDSQLWKGGRNYSRWTKSKNGCLEGEVNGLRVLQEVWSESTGPQGNKRSK